MTPTRFPPLKIGRIGREWSCYDCTDSASPARVGPVYKTKLEAFADLPRYAHDVGWEVN